MMYEEFTEISGCEISFDKYDKIIEPMYMALDMSKQDFCQMIKPTAQVMEREERLERETKAAERLGTIKVVTSESAHGHMSYRAEAIRFDKAKGVVTARVIPGSGGCWDNGSPAGCWHESWGYDTKAKKREDGTITLKLENAAS